MAKVIDRKDIKDEEYRLMLETEIHHNHIIIEDCDKRLRWKENPNVRHWVDETGLGNIMRLLESLGNDKNSEIVRRLFRCQGSSLLMYWETFYWEVNNKRAKYYKPNKY